MLYGQLDNNIITADGPGCSFECSSMLLGSLTVELRKNGLLNPRVIIPYAGHSIKSIDEMISTFRTPKWVSSDGRGVFHSCNLKKVIKPTLDTLASEVFGLNLLEIQLSALSKLLRGGCAVVESSFQESTAS